MVISPQESERRNQYIIDNYTTTPTIDIAQELGVTRSTVLERINQMRKTGRWPHGKSKSVKKNVYSDAEEEFIRQNKNKMTIEMMACALNRPVDGLKSKIKRMGESRQIEKKQTAEQKAELKEIATECLADAVNLAKKAREGINFPKLHKGQLVVFSAYIESKAPYKRIGRVYAITKKFVVLEVEAKLGNYRESVQLADFITGQAKVVE